MDINPNCEPSSGLSTESEFVTGAALAKTESTPIAVAELGAHYLAAPTTKDGRATFVRKICKYFDGVRFDEIEPDDLTALHQHLKQSGHTDPHIGLVMSTLGEMFKLACTKEWLDDAHNPMTRWVKPSRTESAEIRQRRQDLQQYSLLALDEIALLIKKAQGWVLTLILLGVCAGLRGQESRALQRRNVEVLVNRIRLDITQAITTVGIAGAVKVRQEDIGRVKTPAGRRTFDVYGMLADHLTAVLGTLDSPDDFILPPDPGEEFMSYETMWTGLHELQVELGIGRRLPDGSYLGTYGAHALRHTFVALLIWQGTSELRIAAMLGHEVDDVTLTLKQYGYLFAAQLENPDHWPTGPKPRSHCDTNSIILEMENDR